MLKQKAEILGLLCSDGTYRKYYTEYIEFDKRRNNYYKRKQTKKIVEFANTNIKLLKIFQSLLDYIYNYKPNITLSNHNVFRVCITKNLVIDDLIKYTKFGTEKWFVPKAVLNGSISIRSAFIRGFFDGDGSVDFIDNKIPRIRITSTNLIGLKQLKKILEEFEIKCNFNGPYKREYRRDSYEILLKSESIGNFIKYIGSNHPEKKSKFKLIVEAFMPR